MGLVVLIPFKNKKERHHSETNISEMILCSMYSMPAFSFVLMACPSIFFFQINQQVFYFFSCSNSVLWLKVLIQLKGMCWKEIKELYFLMDLRASLRVCHCVCRIDAGIYILCDFWRDLSVG